MQNYSTDFHKIWWKGGTRATEELLHFCGNPDHITLVRVRARLALVIPVSLKRFAEMWSDSALGLIQLKLKLLDLGICMHSIECHSR